MAFESRELTSSFVRIRAFRSLGRLACSGILLLAASSARAATITVNSMADVAANDGQCTLREAITAANTNTVSGALPGECGAGAAGLDTIAFNIAGAGVHTIAVLTPLPTITEAVTIDGYTQPGSSVNTNPTTLGTNAILQIGVDMSSQTGNGLTVAAPSTIRGLVINPTRDIGIFLNTGSNGSTIAGNFMGTNAAGTAAARANSLAVAVLIFSSNNVIGGTTPAARNLLSGNANGVNVGGVGSPNPSNNVIQGNLIGTSASGLTAIPNGFSGVGFGTPNSNNLVGGTSVTARNVISGNGSYGVILTGSATASTNNVVQGNYIGVDVTGSVALPNLGSGIANSSESQNNLIGGTVPGAGNLISGNGFANVSANAVGTLIQGNLIGPNAAGTGAPTGSPAAASGVNLGTDTTVGGTAAGAGNVIAFNSGSGVLLTNSSVLRGAILGNSIHSNTQLGIDYQGFVQPNDACDADTGANNQQNFPVLTSVVIAAGNVTISGTLNSTASTTFRVEFFSNAVCDPSGNGEGQTFLGFAVVTTNASCNGAFGPLVFAVPPGQTIFTATATDPVNNTSQFSACLAAGAPPPTPTPTATATATPTSTPVGPTPTPTLTPTPVPAGGAASVPTLTPNVLAFLGLALALAALFVLRKSG